MNRAKHLIVVSLCLLVFPNAFGLQSSSIPEDPLAIPANSGKGHENETTKAPKIKKANQNKKRADLTAQSSHAKASRQSSTHELLVSPAESAAEYGIPRAGQSKLSLSKKKKAKKDSLEFKNTLKLGFDHSAYRKEGEDFPTQALSYMINPTLSGACFSIESCEFGAAIEGEKDLHSNGKHSLSAINVAGKLKPSPWGKRVKPSFGLVFHFPATDEEIEQRFQFGTSGSFGLGTTPELMGSDFMSIGLKIDLRRNFHGGAPTGSPEWASRQGVNLAFNLAKTVELSLSLGHIWTQDYLGQAKEVLNWNQGLTWEANELWTFFVEHNNGSPMFSADGSRLDTNVISIDNSVLSAGLRLTQTF